MTNPRIDLPSQRKYFDITAIEGSQKPKNDTMARFLFILAVLGLMLGAWLISHPESAKAKTIELRDCRNNLECCQLAFTDETHVRDENVLAKCKSYGT